jgi:hypothetical protein
MSPSLLGETQLVLVVKCFVFNEIGSNKTSSKRRRINNHITTSNPTHSPSFAMSLSFDQWQPFPAFPISPPIGW